MLKQLFCLSLSISGTVGRHCVFWAGYEESNSYLLRWVLCCWDILSLAQHYTFETLYSRFFPLEGAWVERSAPAIVLFFHNALACRTYFTCPAWPCGFPVSAVIGHLFPCGPNGLLTVSFHVTHSCSWLLIVCLKSIIPFLHSYSLHTLLFYFFFFFWCWGRKSSPPTLVYIFILIFF